MKCKIFISCGQWKEELQIAHQIGRALRARGFNYYIAKDIQSILEINSGIIWELKNSDGYLFVNFRRERLKKGEYRGSLFSHQEFAIAYALGFDRLLVINQKGVRQEGMLRYFGCNTEVFASYTDCVMVVKRALTRTNWQPIYSRRLWATQPRFSAPFSYGNGHIQLNGSMLHLDIHNGRPDIAALETTARLVSLSQTGSAQRMPSPIGSPLKAAGKHAFSHTIFPSSHETFDLLCIGTAAFSVAPQLQQAYLNSALDLVPTPSLPITNGTWELEYQFCAIDFPLLTVVIEIVWPQSGQFSARVLKQENS
jgi:hypothetical protein